MIWIRQQDWVAAVPLWLTLGCVGLLAVACDGGGSKQASLYRKLEGAWKVQELHVDKTPYNFRDRAVTVTFDQEGQDRSFVLKRVVSGDSTIVRGSVDLAHRQQLAMVTGFNGPLVWRYTFEEPSGFDSTVQFALTRASDRSVRSFLTALGVGGGAQTVQINFVRD